MRILFRSHPQAEAASECSAKGRGAAFVTSKSRRDGEYDDRRGSTLPGGSARRAPRNRMHRRGFALIVTLSLMILLTVIAVGLLTLSGITLRTSSQGASQAIADSNARLALMLAVGELQKSMGPDQRISASSSSFGTGLAQPNLVGVWESLGWEGPDGAPPSPSQKAGQFRRWLVSTQNSSDAASFGYSQSQPADSIWLANPDTTGRIDGSDTTMQAERVPVTAGAIRGGLAWMISDESMKVPINIPRGEPQAIAGNIANRTSAYSPRPDVLSSALEKISEPTRMISLPTAVLAIGQTDREEVTARSQSLTTSSIGLLTDPVNGGFKTDLTALLESNSTASSFDHPTPYFTSADGAPSWEYLRSHYQHYKTITNLAAGAPKYAMTANSPDLRPSSSGINPDPPREKLLPVIAKLQIIFSLVSHHAHIGNRIDEYNARAVPRGNTLHAVPHLVYDPVVTLYNPYDVQLEVPHLRIQISDPPIGFQFQKHDLAAGTNPWYRDEFGGGQFHGLARFQIANERNPNARKVFTLFLRDKRSNGSPGGVLTLLPGEVKVFSPWVEPNWTWGLEVSGGEPRAFFDWNLSDNLGNRDNRTKNDKGVETVPGVDFRAGLQTDHLSYEGNGRSAASKYPWEDRDPFGQGFLSMKLTDDVTVNARPQRVVSDARLPDFRVDILAGRTSNARADILRTYEFKLEDVADELSERSNSSRIISRRFRNRDILQTPGDRDTGGKSPFAIFTMTAKTTKDPNDDSKAWLFNNMVTEGGQHESGKIGNAAQSYDLRLREIADFDEISIDGATNRGFFGADADANGGVSVVPKYRVPVTPAASLGDWIASNLVASSQFPRVSYPLGNSFAHPLIPSSQISVPSPMATGGQMLDHTYLMNAALWDAYYFSSATDYNTGGFSNTRNKAQVLSDFFTGEQKMLNSRLIPYLSGSSDAESLAAEYASLDETDFARQFAANALIQGAFNVNSTSVDAWRAILSSLRGTEVKGFGGQDFAMEDDETGFVRNGLPVAGSADKADPVNTINVLGQIRWAGFRTLSDSQIENLARLIVEEIRNRASEDSAPSLSLADFVNRRVGSSSSVHSLKGILQTAIDESGVNDDFHSIDSNDIMAASLPEDRTRGLANAEALSGFTADGAAPFLTQGDLLTALAPIITARGDTFKIRAYGESRTADGTKVLARSWCEATVQRTPEFVDPSDAPEAEIDSISEANRNFGRRFVVTSFRWLNSSEI